MKNILPAECAGKFEYDRLIATGGFGSVHLVTQTSLARPVALKLLNRTAASGDVLKRFMVEARVTASLSHPNIVGVIDYGEGDGTPWIAYEYIKGKSLREILDERGSLPALEAIDAVRQTARALEIAHDAGVLHRDIKPDNILQNQKGLFKVTDFGIAKWRGGGAAQTEHGIVLGTPAYIPPELLAGESPSPSSDIYSLGITFFELLTGRVPFRDDEQGNVFQHHLRTTPVAPSRLKSDLPTCLDTLVLRMLEKSPADRFGSVAELLAGLEDCLPALTPATKTLTQPLAPAAPGRPSRKPSNTQRNTKPNRLEQGGLSRSAGSTVASRVVSSRVRWGIPLLVTIGVVTMGLFGWVRFVRNSTQVGKEVNSLSTSHASTSGILSTLAGRKDLSAPDLIDELGRLEMDFSQETEKVRALRRTLTPPALDPVRESLEQLKSLARLQALEVGEVCQRKVFARLGTLSQKLERTTGPAGRPDGSTTSDRTDMEALAGEVQHAKAALFHCIELASREKHVDAEVYDSLCSLMADYGLACRNGNGADAVAPQQQADALALLPFPSGDTFRDHLNSLATLEMDWGYSGQIKLKPQDSMTFCQEMEELSHLISGSGRDYVLQQSLKACLSEFKSFILELGRNLTIQKTRIPTWDYRRSPSAKQMDELRNEQKDLNELHSSFTQSKDELSKRRTLLQTLVRQTDTPPGETEVSFIEASAAIQNLILAQNLHCLENISTNLGSKLSSERPPGAQAESSLADGLPISGKEQDDLRNAIVHFIGAWSARTADSVSELGSFIAYAQILGDSLALSGQDRDSPAVAYLSHIFGDLSIFEARPQSYFANIFRGLLESEFTSGASLTDRVRYTALIHALIKRNQLATIEAMDEIPLSKSIERNLELLGPKIVAGQPALEMLNEPDIHGSATPPRDKGLQAQFEAYEQMLKESLDALDQLHVQRESDLRAHALLYRFFCRLGMERLKSRQGTDWVHTDTAGIRGGSSLSDDVRNMLSEYLTCVSQQLQTAATPRGLEQKEYTTHLRDLGYLAWTLNRDEHSLNGLGDSRLEQACTSFLGNLASLPDPSGPALDHLVHELWTAAEQRQLKWDDEKKPAPPLAIALQAMPKSAQKTMRRVLSDLGENEKLSVLKFETLPFVIPPEPGRVGL